MLDDDRAQDLLDEGIDLDWALTRGVEAVWRYAFRVQPLLVDIRAAHEIGDWPLSIACCQSALRGIVECEQLLEGPAGKIGDAENHLRLAFHDSAAAEALRSLYLVDDTAVEDVERAMTAVGEHNERLRARFPFVPPLLRSPGGPAQSMRLSATIGKWRAKRGLDAMAGEITP